MAYIATTDITDVLAKQFTSVFSTYHTLSDSQMVDIAAQLGITNTDDISVDDDGYISSFYIKQYLVSWFCMRLFLDKIGLNNNELSENEKYNVKYHFYLDNMKKKEKGITIEMVTGNVQISADRSSSTGYIYRG